MKWMQLLSVTVLLCGCTGNQQAKTEPASEKSEANKTAPATNDEIPADPYAAMEMERNAVNESIAGKVTEVPKSGENTDQQVYSGFVKISGKASPDQTIILDTNRGSFVLIGDKSNELLADEGKFVTVLGKLTKGNPVPSEFKDLEQVMVKGVVRSVK